MEGLDVNELTRGYRERIRRLALFEPLHVLERKREEDLEGKSIDMKGFGLLTLLFFFEQKLMRQSKTGVKQLAAFLESVSEQKYLLSEEKYEVLARSIIQTFRPTDGKKRRYSYYDWEVNEEQSIEYSILKANNFDVKTNTQYYTLDEDGLELLFATKEFYSEFQLSINQLILRKQLEKGEFKGALRQINEMRIDVETLEERMIRLKHEIQRSIVSEETFERYKQLLEDIYERLAREDEEFKELRLFVKETRERLYSKDVHQKERQTYGYILKINRELEAVHYDHSRLLDQTLTLKNTTLITAQESLYYTGIHSFNFDQDIVSHIVSGPLPVEAMKGILHPFLQVEENERWSPLAVLAEQNITEEREGKVDQGFIEVGEEQSDNPHRQWLTQKYKELMELFLQAYGEQKGGTLSAFMNFLCENDQAAVYEQRYFYDFWLILHQRSPIIQGDVDEQEGKTLLGEALALIGDLTLIIKEGKGIIQKVDRYSIQEMIIEMEGAEDELS
ncbi:replicative DNA helicase [Halalkalibacterium halodurans]|uniref:replicative DNA helicase n=1 Tax=Halalkalibacterium halodurans TaxID=86665 RepID=UPI0010673D14|nr:replicative DNA helicase [Halalkalibacterium halodurans]MED3648820.1 replicative DNA helicase [Halalkalibacterium halodurans]TES47099.1 replicative DNA helicase [Halalkalibacterium halodurans]